MVEWMHKERERRFGEACDPDRMADDIQLVSDREIDEYDRQLIAREIEAKLENERRGPGEFERSVRGRLS